MSYVITYGPLDAEAQISCETADEALAVLKRLSELKVTGATVASYQTADEARNSLVVLAIAERARRRRRGSRLLN